MPQPDYLRVGQLAARLQVSPKTVSRWIKEGRITVRRTLGGKIGRGHARITPEEAERLEAEMRNGGQPPAKAQP